MKKLCILLVIACGYSVGANAVIEFPSFPGTGIETWPQCDINGTKQYTSCKPGYYLSGVTCVQCPDGGTSDDNNKGAINSCYKPANSSFSDNTGSGTYASKCEYGPCYKVLGKCSTTSASAAGTVGTPSATSGQNCWCCTDEKCVFSSTISSPTPCSSVCTPSCSTQADSSTTVMFEALGCDGE